MRILDELRGEILKKGRTCMKKTLTVLDGKPHVLRMDERDGASAKPRRSSLPKNLVLAVALTAVGAAFAGQTFTPRPGATVCYWDDWD
jgi:hypothetical protein